jgi:putative transposase
MKVLAASDFFAMEVWTPRGLVTHYVLFVISVAERVVYIAGITTRPTEAWMLQMGGNLIDEESGSMTSKRYLIIDRETKCTCQFSRLVEQSGTDVIRLPPKSPNLNAHTERTAPGCRAWTALSVNLLRIGLIWLRRASVR